MSKQRGNDKESESTVGNSSSDNPGMTAADELCSPDTIRSSVSGQANDGTKPSSRAHKATGPRTKAGKQRSRRNALKSGIFASVFLLECESPIEYLTLLEGVKKDLRPRGTMETALVENLVAILLRRQRFLRAESAEISKATEFGIVDSIRAQRLEAWDRSREGESSGGMLRHRSNPSVIQEAITVLSMLRGHLEKWGFQKDSNHRLLNKLYGLDHNGAIPVGISLNYRIYEQVATEGVKENNHTVSPDEAKKRMIQMFDQEIECLEAAEAGVRDTEERRREYQTIAASIPSQGAIDRLIRYEGHLSRELERTLTQLEQLRRMRHNNHSR
jgi:hypothetical protein